MHKLAFSLTLLRTLPANLPQIVSCLSLGTSIKGEPPTSIFSIPFVVIFIYTITRATLLLTPLLHDSLPIMVSSKQYATESLPGCEPGDSSPPLTCSGEPVTEQRPVDIFDQLNYELDHGHAPIDIPASQGSQEHTPPSLHDHGIHPVRKEDIDSELVGSLSGTKRHEPSLPLDPFLGMSFPADLSGHLLKSHHGSP